MQSEHYKSAKKKGLLELLKQMHKLMAKGHGDKPIEGELEVEVTNLDAGGDGKAEGDEHEACEHCDGEGCDECPEHDEADEPAEVNAVADDDSDDDDEGEDEPSFKQHVRDFLSGKQKSRPAKKSLVVHQPTAKAPMPSQFKKGDKKRA